MTGVLRAVTLGAVVVLVAAAAATTWTSDAHPEWRIPGSVTSRESRAATVVKVIDGDTFIARLESSIEVRVRLLGIDAPEAAHGKAGAECGAVEATRALASVLEPDQEVSLELDPASDSEDRFGRLLRYVGTPSIRDVGAALVADGFAAAWYPSSAAAPSRDGAYRASAEIAQREKRGSWAACKVLGRRR